MSNWVFVASKSWMLGDEKPLHSSNLFSTEINTHYGTFCSISN
jgi:hypothetical protein